MGTVLTLIWFTGVVISLWVYFGFVYFDLAEFKPASVLRKTWALLVTFVLPGYALTLSSGNPRRIVLAGIGVTAILVPVIIPEADPPGGSSVSEWIYLHTIGRWFADFCMTSVIYVIAVVCSLFGNFWLYAYAAIAILFAVSRSLWIRVQGENVSRVAAPSILMLPLMFVFVFSWVGFIFDSVNTGSHGIKLDPAHWQTDFNELYKPQLQAVFIGWCLLRWPWLSRLTEIGRRP